MPKTANKLLVLLTVLCGLTAERSALKAAGQYTEKAWQILLAGLHEKGSERRAQALSSFDLLGDEPRAIAEAEKALDDENANVRAAAINALGEINSRASLPRIKKLLPDADGKELMAIAGVLKKFNDREGYAVYYEILTGRRKAGGGILSGIKDRKNLEKMGFEEAIGFVPFGGVGLGAYYYFKQNDSANSSVLAISALGLESDPDPESEKALIQACYGDKDPVKVAALRALARRGNPSVIDEIEPAMHSEKPIVSYTAAAAVLHLSRDRRHASLRRTR